jgi:hypothetical protein
MEDIMKCDRCAKMVDETTTSSCAIGGIEVSEYLPNIEIARFRKLCTFEDQFFCRDCMDGNICKDCSLILTCEEKESLKEAEKI